MLGRGRVDSSAGRRPDDKKIERVTFYYCQDNQHKKRREPDGIKIEIFEKFH